MANSLEMLSGRGKKEYAKEAFKQDFDRRPGAADHPTFRVDPIT